MPFAPVQVVVADDSAPYRQALGAVLSGHRDLEVVGEAASGRGVIELIDRLRPQVALVDVMMGRDGGFGVCRDLSQRPVRPATRVILISAYDDPALIDRGRSLGAAAYLSKSLSNAELCAAVLAVAAGPLL